jgi:5-methylcytosine-specific restriction endonuclease McrA
MFTKSVKKQLNEHHKKNKERKRVVAENWTFVVDDYAYENQFETVKNIKDNSYNYIQDNEKSKIMLQQINKKIYGYKQQDIIKKLLNADKFINLPSIIDKMIDCELKCYYCNCEMNVLYDISREMKQWTVDRIDNNLGHNIDNFYIACLECNLKRRRRSDDKFFFTKQMKLVKVDGNNTSLV